MEVLKATLLVIAALAVQSAGASKAHAGGASQAPNQSIAVPSTYEFNWQQSGDSGVSPVQIFDNGERVYLQFSPGSEIPAIFAAVPGGHILLAWEAQPPHIVIPHMESRLAFRLGRREALAWRTGVAPESTYTGLATPSRLTGSAQAPATREQLAMRRSSADALAGQDRSYKPLTAPQTPSAVQSPAISAINGARLDDFLSVAVGINAAKAPEARPLATQVTKVTEATLRDKPAPLAAAQTTRANNRDDHQHPLGAIAQGNQPTWHASVGKTVQETLDDWAKSAGWAPVRWMPDFDYAIEMPVSFTGEFWDAANDLLSAYDDAKRKFRGRAYRDNKVLEVLERE